MIRNCPFPFHVQFVRPEHLEVAQDFANDSNLLMAQKELAQINAYKVRRLLR